MKIESLRTGDNYLMRLREIPSDLEWNHLLPDTIYEQGAPDLRYLPPMSKALAYIRWRNENKGFSCNGDVELLELIKITVEPILKKG